MKTLIVILLLMTGCSHISLQDAKWIATEATHFSQVEARLGSPEQERYDSGIAEAVYIDRGFHTMPLALIPGVNIATMPVWFVEGIVFRHRRSIAVRYDMATGKILHVRQDKDLDVVTR